MSEVQAPASVGHNKGPVTPPTNEDLLADLQSRFPEVDAEMTQIEKDLGGYPKKLTLKDADVAQAMQDLLAKGKKLKSNLKGYKKDEKAPWSGLVNVVMNFFTTREEKLDKMLAEAGAVHEDYLQQKKDEAVRLAEEEAEKQRQAAETARKEAEAAEQRAAEARQREEDAKKAEDEARQRQAAEEERARVAKEQAERLEAEERRLSQERKDRERAEKERNVEGLKQARQHMKRAKTLHEELQAAETAEQEPDAAKVAELDALVKPGGMLGTVLAPVSDSPLLDDDQKALVEELRGDIGEMRKAAHGRLDANDRRKRAREEKAAQKLADEQAETRRQQREEDDRKAKEAREAREKAEKEAEEAKAKAKVAGGEARDARGEQRAAFSDQKGAVKDAAKAGQVADRAENRADRVESKLANSTDADLSRTRGDLGSVGGLRRTWKHRVVDEGALRAVSGPLGPHFTSDALENAVFHVMRAHQASFTGERVEGETIGVPGALFTYESDAAIKG